MIFENSLEIIVNIACAMVAVLAVAVQQKVKWEDIVLVALGK